MGPKFATSSATISRNDYEEVATVDNKGTKRSGHQARMRNIIENYISSYKSTILDEDPYNNMEVLNESTQQEIKVTA